MAKFKLRLIIPNNDDSFSLQSLNDRETFLGSTITDYQGQIDVYNHNKEIFATLPEETAATTNKTKTLLTSYVATYTYDEKLKLHSNAQKELTFSIDDKVFIQDEWVENPYAHLLRVGTQVELTDRYNNCLLFTVSKVDHEFNNVSITYKITCQDSFTYQLTRQNQGYVLKNNENESDFIGALDIDNWTNKIVKDCYLTYEYIPLDTGIYQDTNGVLHKFEAVGDDLEFPIDIQLNNVSKIIKNIYTKRDFAEYYDTIPFSASGSNALAALIDLGKSLGLQLNVVEGLENVDSAAPIHYIRYFFFGPTKNSDVSTLTYSPLRDIQNFSLSFSGDSLTTVLNVNSTTWEDQEIGLLPKIPNFFLSYILTEETWKNSIYYPGYFLDLIKGVSYSNDNIFDFNHAFTLTGSSNDYTAFIPINRDIVQSWPVCYNQIAFDWDKNHITKFSWAGHEYSTKQYEMGIAVEIPPEEINSTYSLKNIWVKAHIQPNPQTVDWGFGTIYPVSITDTPLQSTLTEYSYTFTVNGENFRYTIVKINNIYYVYLLKEDSPSNYSYYDDFSSPIPVLEYVTQTLPAQYQPHQPGDDVNYNYYPVYTDIPSYLINDFNKVENPLSFYFYIKHTDIDNPITDPIQATQTYMRITRKTTQEELDFAEIAEQCPWLENKLIDFSYFVNLGIISKAEYENLMHFITNDLRIINGQLICYANAYYQSLHKQTKILAQLQANLDKIGAVFYADVIEPFACSGSSKINTTDFVATYNALFNLSKESDAREPILHLNNIIGDYFNKYFNAEQRFLRNIYNFKKFFEAKNIYSLNSESLLQEIQYTINATVHNSSNNYTQVGFNKGLQWEPIESNSPILIQKNGKKYTNSPVYQWQNGHYKLCKVPNIDNYKEFYTPLITNDSPYLLTHEVAYNPKNKYYLREDVFKDNIASTYEKEHWNDTNYVFNHFEIITQNGARYVKMDEAHLMRWFVIHDSTKYYIRDTERKVPFEWVRTNVDVIKSGISIFLWSGLETLSKLINWRLSDTEKLEEDMLSSFWSYYKLLMPIKALYIEDYDIQHTSDGHGEYKWTINDENHHPYKIEGSGSNTQFYQYNFITRQYNSTPVPFNDLYKAYYQVPYLNYRDSLSSIFSDENASSMSVLDILRLTNQLTDLSKNSSYYTKVRKYDWNAFLGNTGLTRINDLLPIDYLQNNPWYQAWEVSDKTEYRLGEYYPATHGTGSVINDGYWQDATYKNSKQSAGHPLLGDLNEHLKGDSINVNYTKTATAEKEIKELTLSLVKSGLLNSLYLTDDKTISEIYWKHYDNYYSKIVATYSTGSCAHDADSYRDTDRKDNYFNSRSANHILSWDYRDYSCYLQTHWGTSSYGYRSDRFWVQNSYAYFCKKDTIINPNDTYIWVKAYNNTDDSSQREYIKFASNEPKVGRRFSAIKFYPLVEGKEKLDLNALFTSEELLKKDYTLEQILAKIEAKNGTLCHFENASNPYYILVGTTGAKYCILHLEPYEKARIGPADFYDDPNNYWIPAPKVDITADIYSIVTDKPINVEDIVVPYNYSLYDQGLTSLVYVLSDEDCQLVKVSDVSHPETFWNSNDTHWYVTNDLNSRTYTINQMLADNTIQYYYLKNSVLKLTEFVNSTDTIFNKEFTIYINTYSINNDQTILVNNHTEPKIITIQNFHSLYNVPGDSITIDDIEITINRNILTTYDIGNMSNGEFWYNFHNRIDVPNLLEKVIVIETELQNYWNQAYTASQYCQWFLPPSWQPETENKINYFTSMLYYIDEDRNKVTLSSEILPDIAIYSESGQTLLPAYIFHYNTNSTIVNGDSFLEDVTYLKNNPAVLDCINHILSEEASAYDLNIYNFTAQENGLTTYYYRIGGGLHYQDILHKLNNLEAIYPKFDGLYVMQLQTLLTQYVEAEATEYETALDKKLLIWRSLYARFPGIFLENTYGNKDARSSKQLLQMAQLAFKDYTSPEKQYNVTLIDATSLEGYQGQELHIGDGILLKSSDYYENIDETYRALNQYLFITDISYDLRQDTGIALTVNIIKYQDKLLQSIVKLIR